MKNGLVKRLKSLNIGIWIGIAFAIYISYYLIDTVVKNYRMQQEIAKLEQQISDLEVESQKLKYQIQYYQTDSYKEKEARARLGLQAPGEGVIMLPNSDQSKAAEDETSKQTKRSNIEQWFDFLSGRAASR